MLVLTRKENEEIVIDLRGVDLTQLSDNDKIIRVVCVQSRKDKTRLGVKAARGIPVFRDEIFGRIEKEVSSKQGED